MAHWVREPGTARTYIDLDTGTRLSRRAYDKMRELEGARTRYDLPRLARQQRAQQKYNDLVRQYSEAELDEVERLLEEAQFQIDEGMIDDEDEAKTLLDDLFKRKRTAKKRARENPVFKRAIRELKTRGNSKAANDKRIAALKVLGRRGGIPDWVPEGMSDRYRAGKLRKDRVPKYVYRDRPQKSGRR